MVGNKAVWRLTCVVLFNKVKAAAKEKGVEFLLPVDVVLADNFAEDANTQVTDVTSIPDGWMVSPSHFGSLGRMNG